MAHTNSTTNYALPQFVSSDKPAWLTDVNTAYADIDTGMHNAQVAADNAQSDATQALSDASTASSTATSAEAKASGAIASISDSFDTTATYSVGDYVIYNNLLYRCIVDVITPGSWTGSANWERTTIESIIDSIDAADIPYDSNESVSDAITSLKTLGTLQALFTVAQIGTTASVYSNFNNRKFSDYKILIFNIGTNPQNTRRSIIMTSVNFTPGATINEAMIMGSTTSSAADYSVSSIEIAYNSDTSFSAKTGGNSLANYLTIYGIKL